jgi:hypothetical protein
MIGRVAKMRATRISTRRDHKQEASFPQAIFLTSFFQFIFEHLS